MTAQDTSTTVYIAIDAEYDLAESNRIPCWSDLSDEARYELVEAFTRAYVRVGKRLYGDKVDILTALEFDAPQLGVHVRRNADDASQERAREMWQTIHDHVGMYATKTAVSVWTDKADDGQFVRTFSVEEK